MSGQTSFGSSEMHLFLKVLRESSSSSRQGPSLLFWVRGEAKRDEWLKSKAQRADSGDEVFGKGAASPLGVNGSTVSSCSKVRAEPQLLKGFLAF